MNKFIITRERPYKARPRLKQNGLRQLVKNRKPTLVGVAKLLEEITSFIKIVEIDKNEKSFLRKKDFVQKEYGARTAEDMAKRRKIIVAGERDKKTDELHAVWGCHQKSILFCKALRKMGLTANTYRYNLGKGTPHTIVIFELNGKKYDVDPFYNEIETHNPEILKITKKIPAEPISYDEFRKQKKGKAI